MTLLATPTTFDTDDDPEDEEPDEKEDDEEEGSRHHGTGPPSIPPFDLLDNAPIQIDGKEKPRASMGTVRCVDEGWLVDTITNGQGN